jgi:hypothetical protein
LPRVSRLRRGVSFQSSAMRILHRSGRQVSLPFGFEVGVDGALVPIGAQQEAIREIAALRAQGRSLRAIRDEMRAKGFQISQEGVARILKGRRAA